MQLPLVWAARSPPAPDPPPAPRSRRPRDPDACGCRHAEGPYCGALARDGGTPTAHHIMRGGGQDGCPGRTPKRTR